MPGFQQIHSLLHYFLSLNIISSKSWVEVKLLLQFDLVVLSQRCCPNSPEVLSSASDKANRLLNFPENSNLDDSGISLPVFPSRTNFKLHNISVTPKMVKKVIMKLDLSKASGPDCIPVVDLKNCEPELCYTLAELFNKCLTKSSLLDCWKVSSMVPIFKNVRKEGLLLKTMALLVFFPWLVKSLKNL